MAMGGSGLPKVGPMDLASVSGLQGTGTGGSLMYVLKVSEKSAILVIWVFMPSYTCVKCETDRS